MQKTSKRAAEPRITLGSMFAASGPVGVGAGVVAEADEAGEAGSVAGLAASIFC